MSEVIASQIFGKKIATDIRKYELPKENVSAINTIKIETGGLRGRKIDHSEVTWNPDASATFIAKDMSKSNATAMKPSSGIVASRRTSPFVQPLKERKTASNTTVQIPHSSAPKLEECEKVVNVTNRSHAAFSLVKERQKQVLSVFDIGI